MQCNRPHIRNKLNALITKLKQELDSISSQNLRLLTSNDFSVMSAYEKVLEPVARALNTMQGEKVNSQGFILPVLHSLKIRIAQIEPTNNIIKDFKAVMMSLINGHRLVKYFQFNIANKDFILPAATLPRFKMNFIAGEENKLFVKNLLTMDCKKIGDEDDNQVEQKEIPENVAANDDFIIFYSDSSANRRNSIDNVIENEVVQYLNDSRVNLDMLNDYKFIRKLFYKYNTTLSSSAPVERVFSQSTLIFTPRRNRISNENFEKVIFPKT